MPIVCCDYSTSAPAVIRLVRTFLVICLFFLCSLPTFAQNESPYAGTRFLIAIPDTVTNERGHETGGPAPRIELIIYSTANASVRLDGVGVSRTIPVAPDASQTVDYEELFRPASPIIVDEPGRPFDFRSVEITSDVPIYMYCRIVTAFGAEMFAPLPVERWGTQYNLVSLRNDPLLKHVGINVAGEEGLEQSDAPAEFLVIASEDNTQLSFEALPQMRTGTTGIMLDAGEVVLLQTGRPFNNLDVAPRDLTGAVVRADKPIAVISGNTRSAGDPAHSNRNAYRITAPTTNSARNLLLEWLQPVSEQGQTFVYAPILTDFDQSVELIRVLGSGPGVTELTTSFGGPPINIIEKEFAELESTEWRMNGVPSPFVLRTDRPAEVAVVTGSWAEKIVDPAGEGYGGIKAWSPAMTLLPPVKDWLNVGRIPHFDFPAAVDQSIVLVADQDAILTLDGRPIVMVPIAGTAFQWGRVPIVGSGDHIVESIGGKFGGIVYGIRHGYEAYRPLRTDKNDRDPLPLHIAEYEEDVSVAWATPLLGIAVPDDAEPDHIEITSKDYCDSTVVQVDRIVEPEDIWTLGPLTATLDPGGVNVTATIIRIDPLGPVLGYHIVFTATDPDMDASGSVTIRGRGVTETVSFEYAATMVTLPDEIDFGTDLVPAVEVSRLLSMTNRRSFTGTVIAVELANDNGGFRIDGDDVLPKALRSGGNVEVEIRFTGTSRSRTYRDTLLVYTDCGIYHVPLHAETSDDIPLFPEPSITGYDWGIRPLNSRNDTLSFAGNTGGRSYTIRDVEIVSDPAGAFSLIPPAHGNATVDPVQQHELGIRFVPPSPGSFTAVIRLISNEADPVEAELRGIGVDTTAPGAGRLEIAAISFDTICLGDRLDTFLTIRNIGTAPTTVTGADIVRATNGTLILADPSVLPRAIAVNGQFQLSVRVSPTALGPFEFLIGIDTSAGSEGTIVRIDGVAVECEPPELTATDHDFGTIWITTDTNGSVLLRNVGRGDVEVLDATIVDDVEGAFTYISPIPPFVVPEGEEVEVTAQFLPMTVGRKTAAILFETEIGDRRSELVGVGKRLVIPARIRRDYHAAPGEEVAIDVELLQPTDAVYPERIDLSLGFADDLLSPLGAVPGPGIGLPEVGSGEIGLALERDTAMPLTGGVLFRLRFLTRISLLQASELPFELTCELPYVEFIEEPGLFTKDPFCLLEERLFEFTAFGLELVGPTPNPATESAQIELEIPFDTRTRIVVYDLLGNERLVLLDGLLPAGRYTYIIPVDQLENGTYVIRINGGQYAFTRRLDVQK